MHRRAFLALLGSAGAAVALARVPILRAEEIVALGVVRRDGDRVFVRARCAEAVGAGDVVAWYGHTIRPAQGWPAGPFGVAEAFSPVGEDTWVQIYGPLDRGDLGHPSFDDVCNMRPRQSRIH